MQSKETLRTRLQVKCPAKPPGRGSREEEPRSTQLSSLALGVPSDRHSFAEVRPSPIRISVLSQCGPDPEGPPKSQLLPTAPRAPSHSTTEPSGRKPPHKASIRPWNRQVAHQTKPVKTGVSCSFSSWQRSPLTVPREAALCLGRKHVPSRYPRLNSLSTATAKLAGPPPPCRRARAWVGSLSFSLSPPACTDTWPHREAHRPPASERQSFCPPTPHASETLGEDSVPWSPLLLPNPCLHEAHAYGHSPATLPAAVTYHLPVTAPLPPPRRGLTVATPCPLLSHPHDHTWPQTLLTRGTQPLGSQALCLLTSNAASSTPSATPLPATP